MRSKNARSITEAESRHMLAVKELACSVCDASAPSEAHHIEQGLHYTCIALCPDCHRGRNGWHGTKALWRIRKLTEMDALNTTLKRLSMARAA